MHHSIFGGWIDSDISAARRTELLSEMSPSARAAEEAQATKTVAKQTPKYRLYLELGDAASSDTKFIDAQLGIAKIWVENEAEMAARMGRRWAGMIRRCMRRSGGKSTKSDDVRMTAGPQSEVKELTS